MFGSDWLGWLPLLIVWGTAIWVAHEEASYRGRGSRGILLGVLLGPLGALVATQLMRTVEAEAHYRLKVEMRMAELKEAVSRKP